ncbi:hypothetical protein PoB_001842300 [Plakobranchus ocellatus]|uniref:Uncharacterized protein n=1 Tax=Plakobranchus ocellatus TaxID=259542 RepID=A0AAV3ZBF7_9GAST|nr:hypothetical protein PoB_001842300 [Plakobranchus ocellatus]
MLSLELAIARLSSFLIDKYLSLFELANIQKRVVVISLSASAKVFDRKTWLANVVMLIERSGGGGRVDGWSDSISRVSVGGDGGDGSGDGGGNVGGSGDAIEGYRGHCIANLGGIGDCGGDGGIDGGGDGDNSGVGGDGDGSGDSVVDGCEVVVVKW